MMKNEHHYTKAKQQVIKPFNLNNIFVDVGILGT